MRVSLFLMIIIFSFQLTPTIEANNNEEDKIPYTDNTVPSVLEAEKKQNFEIKRLEFQLIDNKLPKEAVSFERYEFEIEKLKDPITGKYPKEEIKEAYLQTKQILDQRKNKRESINSPIGGVYWKERGPINIGGRTRALMWDPNDSGNGYKKVWAGGVSGGLWYNNDIFSSSSEWQNVDDFWANLAVTCIAYDPSNTNTFYVGTGEGWYNGDAVSGGGLWKTTDGGSTWALLTATDNSNFDYIQDVEVASNGRVFVASESGFWYSDNGGTSFTKTGTGFMSDIEIASNGDVYLGKGRIYTSGAVYKSTNNGVNWDTITPAGSAQRIELACAPSDSNYVYVAASNGSNMSYIKRSTDGGSTWDDLQVPMYLEQNCQTSVTNDFTRGQAWYDLIMAVDPDDRDRVVLGGIDLYITVNGGSGWDIISYWTGSCFDYVHADQHALKFHPNNNDTLLIGNDGGVFLTSDLDTVGVNFDERNNYYNVTQYYSCAAHPSNDNYFLGGTQDNGTHRFDSSEPDSVETVTGGDGAFCFIDPDSSDMQISSYVYSNYYFTSNAWSSNTSLFANQGRFINPTAYAATDTSAGGVGAGTKEGLIYCAYLDDTYAVIGPVRNQAYLTGYYVGYAGMLDTGKVCAITASPNNNHILFMASHRNDSLSFSKVIKLTNPQNATYTSVTEITPSSANFVDGVYVSCIAVGNSDNTLLLTLTNSGSHSIWYSTDGGTSWAERVGDLPSMPVRWALFNPNDNSQVMIATEVGVWSTNDITASSPDWEPTSDQLANVRCDMLKYEANSQQVLVGTHGRGLFTTDVWACVDDRYIEDHTVLAGASSTLRATDTIVCAHNNGTFQVDSAGTMTLVTSGNILLKPGFHALPGSSFTAMYDATPCVAPPMIPTDIEEEEEMVYEDLMLYPNPAQDVINIKSNSRNIEELVVYDQLGREVISIKGYASSLDIARLAQGIYYLKAIINEQVFSKKFVKL